MDASRLTRLRREAASVTLATNKVRDASETTAAIKYKNSGVFVPATSSFGLVEPCAIKTVLSMGGSSTPSSSESLLFKNAGVATCCSATNSTKGLTVTLPVDCYSASCNAAYLLNPVLGTHCTPDFVGTRSSPNNKYAPICDSNSMKRFSY